MARSFIPPQASACAMANNPHDPRPLFRTNNHPELAQLPPSSFFFGAQYAGHVALWHTSAPPQVPAPGVPAPFAVGLPNFGTSAQPSQHATTGHKKHRRTRTGCYTCRSRRVKCDEALPVCDRCKKGNRNCVYPLPGGTSSKSRARSGSKRNSKESACSSSRGGELSDQVKVEEEPGIIGNAVGTEERVAGTAMSRPGVRENNDFASAPRSRTNYAPEMTANTYTCSSPSTESSVSGSLSSRSASVPQSMPDSVGMPNINQLPPGDLRFYLSFHQQFVTNHHYWLKSSGGDRFVHQTMVDFALQYEPLLYAMVGFSAYLHTLQSPGGRLHTFLRYYHRALTLLRKSLGSGEEYSEAMLITVLVLTTFEEYIGDWMSLIDHHRAAHALMCELYTPEATASQPTAREILVWYARFDIIAGILAGSESILSREWYVAREEYDAEQAARYPNSISKQMSLAGSINRRFGLDMASLYAKLHCGMISMEDFIGQNDQLYQTLDIIEDILRRCDKPEYAVHLSPQSASPTTDDDVIDVNSLGKIYRGPLWDLNFLWIDLLSTALMFKYQSTSVLHQHTPSDLQSLALEQCRLIEAIDRWPEKKNGYLIAFKNSLGITSMFLPRDEKILMWSRKKYARMDQSGYITSRRFRAGLAAIWQIPEISHWWLPNDEGYHEIIRETRAMAEERTKQPRDHFRENVRDMRTLFGKLGIDDSENDSSPPGTT